MRSTEFRLIRLKTSSSSEMIQFTPDDSEGQTTDRFFTIRLFFAAIALTSMTLATILSATLNQLAYTTTVGLIMAIPLSAIYGATSRLLPKKRLLLTAAIWLSFSVFVIGSSFGMFMKIDLRLFYESGEWSPMPPEILSVPLMLISVGFAILSGWLTLYLANVVVREP